jgi:ATP-dependent phosphofructokinase / diphosphate-dependent phosphofructokinase
MKRIKGPKYGVELFATELSSVAEKTKSMPAEFINTQGNGITDAFVQYALPLTGGLPKTEYLGHYPKV